MIFFFCIAGNKGFFLYFLDTQGLSYTQGVEAILWAYLCLDLRILLLLN